MQYIVSKCLKFRLSFNLEVFIINTQQHGSYFYQQLQGRSPNLWPDTCYELQKCLELENLE